MCDLFTDGVPETCPTRERGLTRRGCSERGSEGSLEGWFYSEVVSPERVEGIDFIVKDWERLREATSQTPRCFIVGR